MASYNQKQNSLIQQLKTIVGEKYLLTDPNRTLPYRQGFRFGKGKALAVVIPSSLLDPISSRKLHSLSISCKMIKDQYSCKLI